ncbi:hypothetical protein D3C80_1695690 [compost metagenome]
MDGFTACRRSAWLPPVTLYQQLDEILQRSKDLTGAAHTGNTREDIVEGELVHLGTVGAAHVFGDHQLIAMFPGRTSGRLHANIGGDTAQHHRFDTPTAQLQVQIGAIECAPLTFGDQHIAVLYRQFFGEFPPGRWQPADGRR